MIFWIEKEYKDEYIGSAVSSGIRYKFSIDFDEKNKNFIKEFIKYLRRKYYFPIRLNITFSNSEYFNHILDNHKYYAAFYDMSDEKRKIYPIISVAAKITKNNSIDDVLFAIAHEITHYFQWYFLEEEKRTDRSLEIEANKWANYILEEYNNEKNYSD